MGKVTTKYLEIPSFFFNHFGNNFPPCSNHTAAPELLRCLHRHWCSSWPWWQPSEGSPGSSSTPHPRCWTPFWRPSTARLVPAPPTAYCWSQHERGNTQQRFKNRRSLPSPQVRLGLFLTDIQLNDSLHMRREQASSHQRRELKLI